MTQRSGLTGEFYLLKCSVWRYIARTQARPLTLGYPYNPGKMLQEKLQILNSDQRLKGDYSIVYLLSTNRLYKNHVGILIYLLLPSNVGSASTSATINQYNA